jgi:hypothetical protein
VKLVNCPECNAPAEVLDEFEFDSTDGPISHAKVLCVLEHQFMVPTHRLQVDSSWLTDQ